MEFSEKEIKILNYMFDNMQAVLNLIGDGGYDGIEIDGETFSHNDLFELSQKIGLT